jgi:hypothetical protein
LLAEIGKRIDDILARLPLLAFVVLRHDASLLQLIEQEATVGRQRTIAFVLTQ